MATKRTVKRRKPSEVPVSAPIKKPTDGRPSLEDARGLAKQSIKSDQTNTDRPGSVQNAEPGLDYYYWDALELDEARQVKLRLYLSGRGYWKTSGEEYVSGVPHAEIWATYDEVRRDLDKARRRKYKKLRDALHQKK